MISRMSADAMRARMRSWPANPVARAFAFSLLFHFLALGTLELGHQLGWWEKSVFQTLTAQDVANLKVNLPQQQQPAANTPDIPLVFVEVDPQQASQEPPKDSKYYSAHNSVAANPDISEEKNTPKIDGKQNEVVKTIDKPRTRPEPLIPSAPLEPDPQFNETTAETQPRPESKPPVKTGDTDTGKPQKDAITAVEPTLAPATEPQPPARRRPRRLGDVAQQEAKTGLAGEKKKQDGGTKRFAIESSLDVRATPFGAYDNAIIAAIQQRWWDLLDQRNFSRSEMGSVVLEFKLHSNGRVSGMTVVDSSVNELLALFCQRAVLDPAPYAPWPSDMRRLIGSDIREVRFTFHYK